MRAEYYIHFFSIKIANTTKIQTFSNISDKTLQIPTTGLVWLMMSSKVSGGGTMTTLSQFTLTGSGSSVSHLIFFFFFVLSPY